MMATPITKQSRRTQFTTNYRTAKEGSIYNELQNSRGVLAAKLANKREKVGGDGGFTVSLRQPLSPCA